MASFDSASVLHAATVSALAGKPFPHLGNPVALADLVRVAGRLPWPILREVYARIGGAEGIKTLRLDRVDMEGVAASFAQAYPQRSYPAALVGSSNGALTHLAAAMQVPWLPGTVLIPVARVADPHRPDLALEFGRRVAPALLAANPSVVLHQMHDSAQDELMSARMTYFRTKWSRLPAAYARFLDQRLAPGAPVILVDDTSVWPVTRVGERHVFQDGGRGGLSPQEYQRLPHATRPDDLAPEAEWGADRSFGVDLAAWCAAHDHPLVRLVYDGPQAAAGPVADTIRRWYAELGRPTDRLIVPSFVLGDPWRTLQIGAVPYWTFFPVATAVAALDRYLDRADPFREIAVLMFQHGAESPGHTRPDDLRGVVSRHGATVRMIALDEAKVPTTSARWDATVPSWPGSPTSRRRGPRCPCRPPWTRSPRPGSTFDVPDSAGGRLIARGTAGHPPAGRPGRRSAGCHRSATSAARPAAQTAIHRAVRRVGQRSRRR